MFFTLPAASQAGMNDQQPVLSFTQPTENLNSSPAANH
jgi:hypothetical protein